jgi:hypothetical protein
MQVFELRADKSPCDIFDGTPVVIAIQFAKTDDVVGEVQFQDALWQGIKLYRPRGLARDRELVKRLVNAGTIDRFRPCRHDDFRGDNSLDLRHEQHTVVNSQLAVTMNMISSGRCLVIRMIPAP